MNSSKNSRWFVILFLAMLALRFGYKYYRSQQPSAAQQHMRTLSDRQQALRQAIRAYQDTQRAAGHTAVTADSTLLQADSSQLAR